MNTELDIPRFLRRRPGRKARASPAPVGPVTSAQEPAKVERVQLTEFVRLAETPAEEGGFMIREGILPRRWYEGQSERAQEEIVANLHMACAERALRAEMRAEREAKPERVSKYAGLLSMEDVLQGIAPKERPELATAKAAIRASRIEHLRFWFAPELADAARGIIRNYKPGETKKARRTEFERGARIVWRGKNPKREGSDAWSRWELLRQHHGRTVAEFLAAGGNPTTLRNAVQRKSVKLGQGGEDGSGSGQGGGAVQQEGGAGVRQDPQEAGAVARREPRRARDAGGRARRPEREARPKAAGRARRHR